MKPWQRHRNASFWALPDEKTCELCGGGIARNAHYVVSMDQKRVRHVGCHREKRPVHAEASMSVVDFSTLSSRPNTFCGLMAYDGPDAVIEPRHRDKAREKDVDCPGCLAGLEWRGRRDAAFVAHAKRLREQGKDAAAARREATEIADREHPRPRMSKRARGA